MSTASPVASVMMVGTPLRQTAGRPLDRLVPPAATPESLTLLATPDPSVANWPFGSQITASPPRSPAITPSARMKRVIDNGAKYDHGGVTPLRLSTSISPPMAVQRKPWLIGGSPTGGRWNPTTSPRLFSEYATPTAMFAVPAPVQTRASRPVPVTSP